MIRVTKNPPLLQAIVVMVTLLCCPLLCAAQVNDNGFKIDGIANGMADGTWLFLEMRRGSVKFIDSTRVYQERFHFSGTLNAAAEYALLRTKPATDYKFLWLENKVMTFNGEKGSFRNARLTGSRSEEEKHLLDSLLETVGESKRLDQYAKFITGHPNSVVSGHLLSVYASTLGRERAASLFNTLSEEVKETTYGKAVAMFLSLNTNPRVGDHYTDFTQPDVSGKPVRLSDFKGKVVLLEFWGSWCGPCRKTNPVLVNIYHEFRSSGFEVLGVASESNRSAWLNAIKKDKLPWTNVTELQGDRNNAAMIYGISYYPSNFLIDRTGTIIARDISGNELRRMLRRQLGGKYKR